MVRAARLRVLIATAATTLVASSAAAQPTPATEPATPDWVKSQTSRAGLELDFWPRHIELAVFGTTLSVTYMSWSFTPVAQIGVTDHIFVTGELPIYLSHGFSEATTRTGQSQSDTETDLTAGNPTPGAYYAASINPDVSFYAGGSVSIPVHFEPSLESLFALTGGLSRAGYDAHRFVYDMLPIRPRGGAEIRLVPHLTYRADVATPFFIPLGGEDFEFSIEEGNEVEYVTDSGFGGGARLQFVFPLTENDLIQTASELFGVYEAPAKAGPFARLGFLLALDKRLGFGFDQGKVASLRLSGGYKF